MSADGQPAGGALALREGLRATILAGMAEASALDFRTFTMGSGRKGFRLEAAFWEGLDALCKRENLSRAELLAEVLAVDGSGQLNATSLVRTFVAAAQSRRLAALEGMFSREKIIALLQHAPVAAFAMDRNKRMLRANPEFLRVVRLVWGAGSGELPISALKLTLTTSVEEIFETLSRADDPVQSGIVIEIRHRQRKANARIVAVPGERVEAVVGYILL